MAQQDGTDTFSACLLVLDENFRLPEWIAYHYYALPLRYLVVAVDPASKTSPSSIFDQWRDRMTIIEWTDSDFLNGSLLRKDTDSPDTKKNLHRQRQNTFYQACAWHLHSQNRSWTSFHDADEFLTLNADVLGKKTTMESGFVLKELRRVKSGVYSKARWMSHYYGTCVIIPRALYSAVESTDEEVARDVPTDAVDPYRLDTLRWRYRSTKRGRTDGPGKSILDITKLTKSDFQDELYGRPTNAHRISRKLCPSLFVKYRDSPLGIHHYLGSWEAYSYRDDARKGTLRSYDIWLQRSVVQEGGPDDIIRPWIRGFVDLVGEAEARELLGDAGLPREYRADDNFTESWKSRKSIKSEAAT